MESTTRNRLATFSQAAQAEPAGIDPEAKRPLKAATDLNIAKALLRTWPIAVVDLIANQGLPHPVQTSNRRGPS